MNDYKDELSFNFNGININVISQSVKNNVGIYQLIELTMHSDDFPPSLTYSITEKEIKPSGLDGKHFESC